MEPRQGVPYFDRENMDEKIKELQENYFKMIYGHKEFREYLDLGQVKSSMGYVPKLRVATNSSCKGQFFVVDSLAELKHFCQRKKVDWIEAYYVNQPSFDDYNYKYSSFGFSSKLFYIEESKRFIKVSYGYKDSFDATKLQTVNNLQEAINNCEKTVQFLVSHKDLVTEQEELFLSKQYQKAVDLRLFSKENEHLCLKWMLCLVKQRVFRQEIAKKKQTFLMTLAQNVRKVAMIVERKKKPSVSAPIVPNKVKKIPVAIPVLVSQEKAIPVSQEKAMPVKEEKATSNWWENKKLLAITEKEVAIWHRAKTIGKGMIGLFIAMMLGQWLVEGLLCLVGLDWSTASTISNIGIMGVLLYTLQSHITPLKKHVKQLIQK